MSRFSVIVCGGGPVGTVAAYRLAQAGVSVCLLEAAASPPEDLRASTFHPPTLDMMESLGILDELERQGLKAPVYQLRNRTSGDVVNIDFGELADVSAHPYRLQCEQFKLTRLLAGRLEQHSPPAILFQHRAIYFEQDASGVTLYAETPYAIEQFQADYLIATDGANSVIRKWTGIPFEGFTYPERFLTLSTDWPLERHFEGLADVNYIADASEWCVLLRVPSLWRVLVPSRPDETDTDLVSDAKKTAVFDRLMGQGERVQTPHRTVYRVHQRVATTFRQGRVLLAGDAAHLNNPLGGLGMNSGIHDVWNLTEKLIAILTEKAAADPLLDQYDRQRRTIMRDFVQAQTIRNKAALETSHDAPSKFQRDLERIVADDVLRRDYLLTQSMYKSLVEAEAIA